MRIINNIPNYEPIVHRLNGKVEIAGWDLFVGGLEVPRKFHRKLKKRAGELDIQDAIDTKYLYLRGTGNSNGWFGLVTDKFMPIPIAEVAKAFYEVKSDAIIRYDTSKERFVVSYGIGKFPESTHLFLDSGQFGTYGGNGEMSVRAGVVLYGNHENKVGVVLSESIRKRFIHRWDQSDIGEVVNEIRNFGDEVSRNLNGRSLIPSEEFVAYTKQLSLF